MELEYTELIQKLFAECKWGKEDILNLTDVQQNVRALQNMRRL